MNSYVLVESQIPPISNNCKKDKPPRDVICSDNIKALFRACLKLECEPRLRPTNWSLRASPGRVSPDRFVRSNRDKRFFVFETWNSSTAKRPSRAHGLSRKRAIRELPPQVRPFVAKLHLFQPSPPLPICNHSRVWLRPNQIRRAFKVSASLPQMN